MSDYIEEVKIIQIKTDSLLFVWPDKLLLNGDRIIALFGDQVYQMDSTGAVLSQVGRVGRDLGEYLSISDICFNTDKSKILCQDCQNRVLEYDANSLKFIRTVDSGIIGMSSNAIVPYKSNGFALLVNNSDDCSDFDNDFYQFYGARTGCQVARIDGTALYHIGAQFRALPGQLRFGKVAEVCRAVYAVQ